MHCNCHLYFLFLLGLMIWLLIRNSIEKFQDKKRPDDPAEKYRTQLEEIAVASMI